MNEVETKTTPEATNRPPEFSEEELKMPTGLGPIVEEEHHGKLALVLGLLIVLMVLILGGLYLWYLNAYQTPSTIPEPTPREVPAMPNEPEAQNAEAETQELETVSNSNSLDAIEADIESTNLDELDSELNAIEAELEASL